MSEPSSICDWLCLSLIPGLGPAGARRLLQHYGDVRQLLEAEVKELANVPGMRCQQLNGFSDREECRNLAARQLEAVQALGGTILPVDASGYPELLREIPDPPVVLYALGDIRLLKNSCVAVVGSRSATSYGRRVACSFSETLAAHSLTVVSGLALGIDSEAHWGAVRAGGNTIAVLGCGVDVVYPRQNRKLYEEICARGLLLSEYPLGTQPDGFRFPARNRIIAGISRGVVVVEAARKSGSLITAQMALDFGREVFAVPGQVDSYKSEGTHWLLKQGAQLVTSGAEIVEELCSPAGGNAGKITANSENPLSGLDPDAVALLQHLEPYPLSRDEVSEKAGLTPARLSELFLFLELEGFVEVLPGDLVRKV